MTDTNSNFWLDKAVAEIVEKYPKGEIIVSSGISPSADYHIGHLREILTADALLWGLRKVGRKARHLHVVDNFDPLRKRYDFLPEEFEDYVGWPICLVPDPKGEDMSYADRYFNEFQAYIDKLGLDLEIVKSYEDLYKAGEMVPVIEDVAANLEKIRNIFAEVSNRKVDEDWTPLQFLGEDNQFKKWKFESIDTEDKVINYKDEDGVDGEVKYDSGRVKLNWRLDWPGRWKVLGVMVEPFNGHEHGASGGSYDTGVEFAKQVFDIDPPLPGARYNNINLAGESTKMSSSKGNLVTPGKAMKIMPPELLRYFVLKSRPEKVLTFDTGKKLYSLFDEFTKVEDDPEHEFRGAYDLATAGEADKTIASVRFSHLVSLYQTAQGDRELIKRLLKRTGYESVVEDQSEVLDRELEYVANWLENYAPDNVKFELKDKVPEIDLSDEEEKFLDSLADKLDQPDELKPQEVHDLIYEAKEEAELKPAQAFRAIYRLTIGQKFGPKAGFFLSSLDKDWVVKRLKREA